VTILTRRLTIRFMPGRPPWSKFSLPVEERRFCRGFSTEFRETCREVFGPLVEPVREWPKGRWAWLLAEVPKRGWLLGFFQDLENRLTKAGSLWVVLPKKPYIKEFSFPYSWIEVQETGLTAGLVDNKIAAFSPRLTAIRFVIPVARRKSRT